MALACEPEYPRLPQRMRLQLLDVAQLNQWNKISFGQTISRSRAPRTFATSSSDSYSPGKFQHKTSVNLGVDKHYYNQHNPYHQGQRMRTSQ
jgi:hypothetical protein